jgi:hypothetical protein
MKPTLKAPGRGPLKQKCDELLTNFAVHFNLRRYNEDIKRALNESCSDLKIQPVPAFIDKVIQLYETTVVRHGLMLVGPTGRGLQTFPFQLNLSSSVHRRTKLNLIMSSGVAQVEL